MAKILTVDDSPSMRRMVAYTLKEAGHEVSSATHGEEALVMAKKQKFNLIITDINMPRMDGISLTRELRNLNEYRFTPILTLTMESEDDIKQEGKNAGATGWIIKPFNPEQLLATIKKVLK